MKIDSLSFVCAVDENSTELLSEKLQFGNCVLTDLATRAQLSMLYHDSFQDILDCCNFICLTLNAGTLIFPKSELIFYRYIN